MTFLGNFVKSDTTLTLDSNNPLAGKTLTVTINVEGVGRGTGSAESKVTILEFSEFQCPYCAKAAPTVNRIKEEYGDAVEIVFTQVPMMDNYLQVCGIEPE